MQRWRMAANTVKSQTMVIHPKLNESASVEPEDRAHTWTLNGEVIGQVAQYKYLGIVFQEDGGWECHAAKALNKMRAAYGYWRPLLACGRLPVRVRLLMLQTFVYSAVMYGAEVWDCTQTMREKMSVVVKKGVRTILGLHPMDCACDALYGDTGLMSPGALIDAAKICWNDRCQHADAGRWIKCALDFSYAGRRSAGRPKVGTDWTQSLRKAVSSVQIALNIADVSAPATEQPPMRRVAARRSSAPLVASVGQAEVDTHPGEQEGRQVEGGSVRTAVLNNLWLAALTRMQSTYALCPEGRPGWLPKCLLVQGRRPAEYLSLLPSSVARVITSARSGKLCAMDLASEQKVGFSSDHMRSCMHCGCAQGHSMEAAVHRMLQCASVLPNVARFKALDFGHAIDWDASPDAVLLSVLSPEWSEAPSRETKVLYWNAVANLFGISSTVLQESSDDGEDNGSGLEGASNTLTADVLQGSQVAPGVVNVHVDTADM